MNRNLYRKFKKEKEYLLNRLNIAGTSNFEENVNKDKDENINNRDMAFENDINNSINLNHEEKEDDRVGNTETLKEKLRKWYVEYNPTRETCEAILNILRSEGLQVPKTVKTLAEQSRQEIIKRTVAPGEYIHLGLEKQLLTIINNYRKQIQEIVLDIGTDGLPLFKSSGKSLWPILGKIINITNIKVILIGVYFGEKKPHGAENFLHDFVAELKKLLMQGITIENRTINICIRAFICDAPARSFITGTFSHNSYNGCSKCTQIGKMVNHVVTYSTESGNLRSDESFKNRRDLSYHHCRYHHRETALETANINMISQFPLDAMHLVDLGVTRKIL